MDQKSILKRTSKLNIWRMILVLTVVLAFVIPSQFAVAQEEDQTSRDEIYQLITNYHVSGVTEEGLPKSDIDEMISALDDPYTQYFSEEEWNQFENQLENNYVGIGIRVGLDDQGVYVDEVFPDSPAEQAKMFQGDYIIAVAGQSVKGMTLDEVVSKVTGPEGTNVEITLQRGKQTKKVTAKRAKIKVPVLTSKWFKEGVGYVRISSFSSDADERFTAQLKQWRMKPMKALIIDLRDNPGGLLDTAANMGGHFFADEVMIHTKDRDGEDMPVYASEGIPVDVPVVVLVNENSASASEVLTGALQDYGTAVVLGTRTYGKGSVQNIFPLSDGGYLKMTIEEYMTPLERKVNNVGLEPDIEVYGNSAQLITALHWAGMDELEVAIGKTRMWVNDVELAKTAKTITSQGRTFVPSRLAAALVWGEVKWDGQSKSILLDNGLDSGVFTLAGGGIISEHGVSYVRLDLFEKVFPDFEWHLEQDKVILQSK